MIVKNVDDKLRALQTIEAALSKLRMFDIDAVEFETFVTLNQIKLDYYDHAYEQGGVEECC